MIIMIFIYAYIYFYKRIFEESPTKILILSLKNKNIYEIRIIKI